MAIPQLPKTVWWRLPCAFSWEVFLRNSYFSLSTFFPVSDRKEQESTFSSWQPLVHEKAVVIFPLRFSFFSIEYASCYSFSHRSCFLDLLYLLLSFVFSPIVLPFHQALCVKLDIAQMLGFSRGLNYQNIL